MTETAEIRQQKNARGQDRSAKRVTPQPNKLVDQREADGNRRRDDCNTEEAVSESAMMLEVSSCSSIDLSQDVDVSQVGGDDKRGGCKRRCALEACFGKREP